jgi:hypothetical protein
LRIGRGSIESGSPAGVAGGRFVGSPAIIHADPGREIRDFADRLRSRGARS